MALFVLSLCPFDISVGIGAFVIGLGQISSFLSWEEVENVICTLTYDRQSKITILLCHLSLRVFTFRSWLDFVMCCSSILAFWITILKLFKPLQNYWHRVTHIISFEKHLESFSGHMLRFCQNLVKYCLKNINLQLGLFLWSSLQSHPSERFPGFK